MKTNLRWLHIVSGVLSIVLGFYMLANPAVSLVSLTLVLACVFLVNGISDIVDYFSNKVDRSWLRLLHGVVTIALSFCLFSESFWDIALFVPYLFAFWVIFGSISKMFVGGSSLKLDKSFGSALILLGTLGLIVGFAMMMHPLMTGLFVAYLAAFILMYQGVMSIILFFRLKKQ